MSFAQRREQSFRNGLRVRIGGATGSRGVLRHCESKLNPGTFYWKVRLDNGQWVWPDGLVVDGPGDEVALMCGRCELPYLRVRGGGELICRPCSDEQFGPADRQDDIHPRPFNQRRRWTRNHR
jgi:hypothetical protein